MRVRTKLYVEFLMKFLVPFLLFFAFVACSDEKKEAPSIDTEQNVSIEQSDEKTEASNRHDGLYKGCQAVFHYHTQQQSDNT